MRVGRVASVKLALTTAAVLTTSGLAGRPIAVTASAAFSATRNGDSDVTVPSSRFRSQTR
jgi:hypothetical protein